MAVGQEQIQKHKVMPCTPGWLNTLRPRQNGRHFTYNIFKCIFLHENVLISIKISLKFVSKGPIDNIPASGQIMAWRWHICITRPQWVNYDGISEHNINRFELTETWGPFYSHGLTLIQAWISNDIHFKVWEEINGLVQEKRNSSVLAMELRLSCTNPSK